MYMGLNVHHSNTIAGLTVSRHAIRLLRSLRFLPPVSLEGGITSRLLRGPPKDQRRYHRYHFYLSL